MLFSVLVGLSFSVWQSFLAPAVRELGTGAISGFGLGYGLGAVFTRLGISHRLDTGSLRLAGISALLLCGLGLALVPQVSQLHHLVVVGLVCGMSHGIYYPCLSSIASDRFHPLHTGQAMTLYVSASTVGMALGPPIWGAIADRTGYPLIFAASGLLLAVSTTIFVLSVRR
ncbi:MFS transporter [Acidobacteria bacterium AH-259-G07]|nr:MFS transporter [Acidobacteria bacterium AH-259-G07]